MTNLARANHKVRSLILDYALGAAIIALLPLPEHRIVLVGKAIALLWLHYKLIQGIRRFWQHQAGGDFLARIGSFFGVVSAVMLGIGSWVAMLALSLVVPKVYVLASGVAAFVYFWVIGQTVHHFYLSGLDGVQRSLVEEGEGDEAQ